MNSVNINTAGNTAGNTANVIDVSDLSRVLRKSVSSILADRSRAPHRLPPACTPPGTRQPLWILDDVLDWLRGHREPAAPASASAAPQPAEAPTTTTTAPASAKRRRGRPTKAEQVARAAVATGGA